MSKHAGVLALAGALSTAFAGMSFAAEGTKSDVSVAKDLTAVIALQGLPCGSVVSAKQLGDDDYEATCDNGMRYRVSVDAEGRVVVAKLD